MSGRQKKKCVLIEHYTVCPSNYDGKHVYQMNREELLGSSIKTAQAYENNCYPYNLLFEIFETDELFLVEHDQTIDSIKTALVDLLDTLTPRQDRIVKLLFGIYDGKSRTISEVTNEFNVTPHIVREARDDAIRRLRHPLRKNKFPNTLFLGCDLPAIHGGYEKNKIYMSYVRGLHDIASQSFDVYLEAMDSLESACTQCLSKRYPRELITSYIEENRQTFLWLKRMEEIQDSSVEELTPTPSVRRALLRANIATIGDLYDLYHKGKLLEKLEYSQEFGVGPAKAKQFVDKCTCYFQKEGLLPNDVPVNNRAFLSDTINQLERLYMADDTSIVSPYIPNDWLELCLHLNYKTIEELISDYQCGDLKVRCETKYAKVFLGDIYDALSRFIETFIKKPINYSIVHRVDYAELPKSVRDSLNEKEPKKREATCEFENDDDADDYLLLSDDDDDLLLIDDDDLLFSDDDFEDEFICSLDIPSWTKILLGQAGFTQVKDIIVNSVSDLLSKHKIGFLAIEKLCSELDDRGLRLKGCAESDHPYIEKYLQTQKRHIIGNLSNEDMRPFLAAEFEVENILRDDGTRYCYSGHYYAKGDDFSDWKYVAVPLNNSTNIGIGEVSDLQYFKVPACFESLDHVIRKADQQEYLDRIQAHYQLIAEEEEKKLKKQQEELERNKVAVMTRKQLYDEVWTLSVAGVARKYGITYSRCIRQVKAANIPVPPSGYWTLVAMGKPTEKTALGGATDEIVVLVK